MKNGLVWGALLLVVLVLAGCVSGGSGSSGGAKCLSRPDPSGTQPLIYLLCIQTN